MTDMELKHIALANHMLHDRSLAEDVIQETFIALWKTAHTFDEQRGSVRTWLLTSIRNRCLNILRGQRRLSSLEDLTESEAAMATPDGVWEEVSRSLDSETVRQAFLALNPEQRQVLQRSYFHGLTHVQIAAELDLPLGTVKSGLRLVLTNLCQLLDQELQSRKADKQ
jgi:RNA polymerase sigma-70 factor (ECF subfamily)